PITAEVLTNGGQGIPHASNAEHVGYSLTPLHEEDFLALALPPPRVRFEIPIRRRHRVYLEWHACFALLRQVDATGARRVEVAGDQQKALDVAAPQLGQYHPSLFLCGTRRVRQSHKPILGESLLLCP